MKETTRKMIEIIMIEDHPEYRDAVQHFLAKESDFEIVSIFGNPNQALRFLEDLPDQFTGVILLDLNLPGMTGLEAMPWISKYAPDAKTVILSQSDNESEVLKAIQQGAAGYLLKSSTMNGIKSGIRSVVGGGASLDPQLARYVLDEWNRHSGSLKGNTSLTRRELEILSKVSEGLSQKDIAKEIGISAFTVAEHLTNIYGKLQVQNAPAAVSTAFRKGILR
ncbi:response regulator [Luteolibacter sp. AS25]|uniref:response regulator n=1 Tax=Luteolibacter sp. AS25 TaxID=3135776 RepID=UPI00398B5640